jgi:aminomethyltransferase
VGTSAARRAAAADRIFTNDMLGLEIGQERYAPYSDADAKMHGDGTVSSSLTRARGDHGPTRLEHMQVAAGRTSPIEPLTEKPRTCSPGPPRSCCRLVDEDVESTSASSRTRCTSAGPCLGCARLLRGARLRVFTEPDYARSSGACSPRRRKPYGSAVESLRIESGLIFIGYDYFQHETNPFDMSLDKVIRLDTGDFNGKAALAETAKAPPRRLVTLAVEGSDVPEYGAAVTKDGEPAGTLTSPSESPTLGRVIGMAVLDSRFAAKGEAVEVALGDGSVAATVDDFPSTTRRRRGRAASRLARRRGPHAVVTVGPRAPAPRRWSGVAVLGCVVHSVLRPQDPLPPSRPATRTERGQWCERNVPERRRATRRTVPRSAKRSEVADRFPLAVDDVGLSFAENGFVSIMEPPPNFVGIPAGRSKPGRGGRACDDDDAPAGSGGVRAGGRRRHDRHDGVQAAAVATRRRVRTPKKAT